MRDHDLQVVFFWRGDPYLLALYLGLDLETKFLDYFDEFFRFFVGQPRGEIGRLLKAASENLLRLIEGEEFYRNPSLGEFIGKHLPHRAQFKIVVPDERYLFFGAAVFYGRSAPLKIKPLREFLLRLIDGVIHFLEVRLGNYVE